MKTPEEFVKEKLNEKIGQGITLYEHYLANDTTISIGTAVEWMKEYFESYGYNALAISHKLTKLQREIDALKSQLKEQEVSDKQKLINHFFEEDNILEYWLTQIALSGEIGISLKMTKRLKWVKDQISKIK